ncbi:hypothetical protein [Nocardiopsis sp. LOL_012]|uniref:hypothetical protein n=1 Tax=Nocardiopsis sp. LOL_012 TaxID=3345409 RepID=UPI003A8BE3CD
MTPEPRPGVLGARVLAGVVLAAATVFSGGVAAADPPGDNGTVKIHDPETPADDPKNEPKVCTFYIKGDNFDSGQEVSWEIVYQSGPDKGDLVLDGELVLDQDGHGTSELIELDEGHYKLIWTFEGENGKAKHKVFKVECEDEPTDEPTEPTDEPTEPTDEPTEPTDEPTEPTDEPTEPTDEPTEPTDEPTDGPTDGPSTDPSTGPSDDPSEPADEGGLPVTGSALAGLVAAGAVAVAGGGAALYLGRRKGTGNTQG